MGGYKIHFILRGAWVLCESCEASYRLSILFSKSFHWVFPSVPWVGGRGAGDLQGRDWDSRTQSTGGRDPDSSPVLCPSHHMAGTRDRRA